MIRNLLATTAIATLIATGAVAQTTPPADDPMVTDQQQMDMVIRADGHLASNIIGESVYSSAADDAENIGSVNDIVIGADGSVEAIIVGVGGFLGIGQREVALDFEHVQWAERDGDRWLVVETTRDALEAQPEFDRTAYQAMPADTVAETPTEPAPTDDLAATPPTDDTMVDDDVAATPTEPAPTDDLAATEPTDDTVVEDDVTAAAPADQQPTDDMAAAPTDDRVTQDETVTGAIDRNTLQQAGPDQIRADNLIGTTVYGLNEENIGSIGDVILSPEGEVDAVLVDVGGFLGIGAKEVAIGMENLAFMTDQGGNLYLYTEFTQAELEAQPEFDEATYAERRDEMRLLAR